MRIIASYVDYMLEIFLTLISKSGAQGPTQYCNDIITSFININVNNQRDDNSSIDQRQPVDHQLHYNSNETHNLPIKDTSAEGNTVATIELSFNQPQQDYFKEVGQTLQYNSDEGFTLPLKNTSDVINRFNQNFSDQQQLGYSDAARYGVYNDPFNTGLNIGTSNTYANDQSTSVHPEFYENTTDYFSAQGLELEPELNQNWNYYQPSESKSYAGYSGAVKEDLHSDPFNTQHNTGLSNIFANDHYSTFVPILDGKQTDNSIAQFPEQNLYLNPSSISTSAVSHYPYSTNQFSSGVNQSAAYSPHMSFNTPEVPFTSSIFFSPPDEDKFNASNYKPSD